MSKILKLVFIFLLISLSLSGSILLAQSTNETNFLNELNKQLENKRKEIEELKEKAGVYQRNIETKRQQAVSLENQLTILENRIAKTEIDIKILEAELIATQLEIEETTNQIKEKQNEIKNQKERLSLLLRLVWQNDQKSYLEILLLNDNFGEFFSQIVHLTSIQDDLSNILEKIIKNKKELEFKKTVLEDQSKKLTELKTKQEEQKSKLEEQKQAKQVILFEARASESHFQELLWEARQEQEQANQEILALDRKIRQKLAELQEKEGGLKGLEARLSWSVDPSRGITTYFHDPDYPFRYIFEHPGLDIRASQGTSIKAAESGYVARAKDAGMGYSYIMLIHNSEISTVYGHLSKVLVEEDTFVTKGQVIALTGGTPGTPGAGRLTTGPHLHFEVRLNGIPVNPLEYLP